MHKSFLTLVVVVLSGCFSPQVAAQVTGTKTQPLPNIKYPNNPANSAPGPARTSGWPNPEAKRLLEQGEKLADVEQFSQAVESFQKALKLDNEYADAYAALGRAYFQLQQWQKAVDNLTRAAELRTKQAKAQAQLNPKLSATEQSTAGSRNKAVSNSPAGKLAKENKGQVPEINQNSKLPPNQVRPDSSKTSTNKPPQTVNQNVGAKTKSNDSQTLRLSEPVLQAASSQGNSQIKLPQVPDSTVAALKMPTPGTSRQLVRPPSASPAVNELSKSSPQSNSRGSEIPAKQPPAQLPPVAYNSMADAPFNLPAPSRTNDAGKKTSIVDSGLGQPPEPSLQNDGLNGVEEKPEGTSVSLNVAPPPKSNETRRVSATATSPYGGDASLTKIYKVGPSDVLDVQLNDSQSPKSTLFTVTPSGLLDHPLLNEPLSVTGLTVEEIGTKLQGELVRRALLDNPRVIVGVRDYASHTILVSGLVKDSGTKFLRREAIPLYVVVADAQPLPEAARVTVVRSDVNQIYEIELTQAADMNLLVRPGDVVTVLPGVTQFIYIGGEVKSAGEKTFRRGLTLTQIILAAGGVTAKGRVAQIVRDAGGGFLVPTRFDLAAIGSGKAADPLLKPGDRIVILR